MTVAHEKWSLQECLEYARVNNSLILNKIYDIEISEIDFKDRVREKLPTINSYINTASTFGQGQDIFGNTQRNDNLNSSFGVSSEMNLYNYGKTKNLILKSIVDINLAKKNKEIEERRLNNEIILHYMNIMVKQEMVKLYSINVERLSKEHEKLKIEVKHGKFSKSVELESYADLLSLIQEYSQAKADVSIAKLGLTKVLQLDSSLDLDLEDVIISEENLSLNDEYRKYFDKKIQFLPNTMRYSLAKESLEYQNKIIKSQLYPMITFGGTFGTMFYNSFVVHSLPIQRQLSDNLYQQLYLKIALPIYNRNIVKSNLSRNNLLIKQLSNKLDAEIKEEKNEIESLLINWNSFFQKYKSHIEVSKVIELTLKNANTNFENGKGTFYDLNNIRTKYLTSKIEEIKSKYNCYFHKCLILNYCGELIQN